MWRFYRAKVILEQENRREGEKKYEEAPQICYSSLSRNALVKNDSFSSKREIFYGDKKRFSL